MPSSQPVIDDPSSSNHILGNFMANLEICMAHSILEPPAQSPVVHGHPYQHREAHTPVWHGMPPAILVPPAVVREPENAAACGSSHGGATCSELAGKAKNSTSKSPIITLCDHLLSVRQRTHEARGAHAVFLPASRKS
eukprot:scaffold26542_cov22-Tisochrysis_lutea.AAC.1